jgi:ferredoxin
MRVTVDELRCDAHGVCVTACPEVFGLDDDDDTVTVLVEEPDASLRPGIERAAQMCPKAAISVQD